MAELKNQRSSGSASIVSASACGDELLGRCTWRRTTGLGFYEGFAGGMGPCSGCLLQRRRAGVHECTCAEHPVEELRPAGSIVVRRLQVAFACRHAANNEMNQIYLESPKSASSCIGRSLLRHFGGRGAE